VKSETWTPGTVEIHVLTQNTRMAPEAEAPKTLQELFDPQRAGKIKGYFTQQFEPEAEVPKTPQDEPQWAGKISASSTQLFEIVRLLYPEAGVGRQLEIVIPAKFVPTDISSIPLPVVETPFNLTFESSALKYGLHRNPVKLVYFEGGTLAVPDGLALVKGGSNPESGKKFIDWALSRKTQELLFKKTGRRSVRPDAAVPGEVAPLSSLKLLVR